MRSPAFLVLLPALLLGLAVMPVTARAAATAASADAKTFFVNLKDGDTVHDPFVVKFGIAGMTISPAGKVIPNSGHYHLLIDTTLAPADMHHPIVNDAHHLHFGKGQTETTLNLPPGKHTLQIVMGDGKHELHNPPVMSAPITVTVE